MKMARNQGSVQTKGISTHRSQVDESENTQTKTLLPTTKQPTKLSVPL